MTDEPPLLAPGAQLKVIEVIVFFDMILEKRTGASGFVRIFF
jgi:hypothetical protein